MDNVRTILANLPTTIGGYTIYADGYYTIVLNENLSRKDNLLSYAHEMAHITAGDFEKRCSVDMIEAFAHKRL